MGFSIEENHPLHRISERFLSHVEHPCNMGRLEQANGKATGVGTCGDAIDVYLKVQDKIIQDITHLPHGCLYTIACASAMTCLAKGRHLDEALKLQPQDVAAELDGLPDDHQHCAALAINTLGEAIDDYYQKLWGQQPAPQKADP
jgi:nitrogen fixation NifU-like protein